MQKTKVSVGQVWQHYNGIEYVVVMIANLESKDIIKYPVQIIYSNIVTSSMWCRPLDDWHRSMTYMYDCLSPIEEIVNI